MSPRSASAAKRRPVAQPRFIKISAAGQSLHDDVPEWVAVLDRTTGLMWSRGFVLPDTKPHKDAIRAAAKLKLAGFKDWRAPTLQQRVAIADYGRTGPAIDTRYFDSPSAGWEWTSTALASSPSEVAWSVHFYDGAAYWSRQSHGGFVRACRASQLGALAPKGRRP